MEYQLFAGIKIPVVHREKKTDDINCPYCFRRHSHGTADGHRLSHCATNAIKHRVLVGEEEVDYTNGYIILTK